MKYLVIFQHGPVQEFIRTARRTDDYWAGSYLLSYTTALAIKSLCLELKADIIFPYRENTMVKAIEFDSGINCNALRPSLPNRVAGIIEASVAKDLKNKLIKIQGTLRGQLVSLFSRVEERLTTHKQFSQKHIEHLFESFFVFVPYDEDRHAESFKKAEEAMAARKNMRNFLPSCEYGYKCTQCGVREPLRGNRLSNQFNDDFDALKSYWKNLRKKNPTHPFKDNERLCSICAGKRLLRQVHCPTKGGIPSTSTVTISAWLDEKKDALSLEKVKKFIELLNNTDLSWKGVSVPRNRRRTKNILNTRPISSYLHSHMDDMNAHPLFSVEGDFLIPDSYDHLIKKAENGKKADVISARKALKLMIGDIPAPPKYYSIIAFDGDNMGGQLRDLKSKDEHKNLTRNLSDFTENVYKICNEDFHGYVIYFGGDEGVVLVPLSEALEVMESVRQSFAEKMGDNFTLSAGAAILHHQSPLGEGLKTAQDALKRAKAMRDEKNAFGVNIIKRSATKSICVAPWEVSLNGDSHSLVKFLQRWQDHYVKNTISAAWFYQFAAAESAVKTDKGMYRIDIAEKQMFRILPRHMESISEAIALAEMTVLFMHRGLANFENMLGLLYVPLYISKGGEK